MTTKKTNLYFGGIPTDPDVKKLREAYPHPKEGDLITYEETEKLLGVKKNQMRWRTITWRWRRLHEHETSQVIGCEQGEGFKVLLNHEKLEAGVGKVRHVFKTVRRARVLVGLTNASKLTVEDRKRMDHLSNRVAMLEGAARVEPKQIEAYNP
jgi:hypothetical protein